MSDKEVPWPLLTAHQTTLRGKPFTDPAPGGCNAMHNDRLGDSLEHGSLIVDYVRSDEGTVFEAADAEGKICLWRVVRRVPGLAYCVRMDT